MYAYLHQVENFIQLTCMDIEIKGLEVSQIHFFENKEEKVLLFIKDDGLL